MGDVFVESMYGSKTRLPLVTLRVTDDTNVAEVQLTLDTAHEIAMNILRACESASQDGFIIEWLQEKLSVELPTAGIILKEYRDWRDAHDEKLKNLAT